MKKILLLSLFLSLVIAGQAQVSQTVNVAAGGGLSAAITAAGGNLATITNLTVNGTIDARDFVAMRDSMPVLAVVDISGVTIAAYTGNGGTVDTANITYPENEIPQYAFCTPEIWGKASLTTIQLPVSITSIGNYAFYDSGLTSIILPAALTSIGNYAFSECFHLTSIVIPSLVTSIEDGAFSYCNGLTSVAIPSSVNSIGHKAFLGCSGFVTVDANNPNYSSKDGVLFNKNQTILIQCPISKTGSYSIPSSVTSIGDFAFWTCRDLTSITIPSSVTSIGDGTFGGCSGLTSVIIPSSVTSIGAEAFGYCDGLTSVTISSSVISIGAETFVECSRLISVSIPSSVTSIGDNAFEDCKCLTSVTIPSAVTFIGKGAFLDCSDLTSIAVPSSVTSIGDNAFANCSGFISVDANNPNYSSKDGLLFDKNQTTLIQCPISKTGSYTIPSSVISIGDYAFWNCSHLTSIAIPSSDTFIGEDAFNTCFGLTSVTIPSSVTSIGEGAFASCFGLTSIYAYATTPIDLSSLFIVFSDVNTNGCTLYVPKGSLSIYKAAYLWNDFVNIEEFTPTAISTATTFALKAYTQNGQLIVTGIPQGETLTVYTVQGTPIYSQKTDGNQVVVNLPAHGIYIVKAGAQSVKVVD